MISPPSGTPTVGLGRFIKENHVTVPSHQRDYSWTEEYVKEFMHDIEEAITTSRSNYFCGLMVFTSTGSARYKVLDGQQRLATTLMIFSAVRNWFGLFGEYGRWKNQAQDYLESEELGSQITQPRLSLTAANNDAFQQCVIKAVPHIEIFKGIKGRKFNDRSITLLSAAIWINRYIERRASEFPSPDDAKEFFLKLLVYLSDSVRIVQFVPESDDAAYTIFETLNDRGLELSPLDLVKNYLFSHAEKHRKGSLREFEERWTEMMSVLSSPRADSFLRAFWASRYGKPEGAKLFTAFKKINNTPEALYQISIDLRRDAERYAALFASDDPIWSQYSILLRRSVEAIGIIGFSQSYAMVLAGLEKFDRREMERLLRLIECIAVRYQLIGRLRPGRVESLSGRAAKEIFEGRATTATEVFSLIRELYVPDEEFRVSFESASESSSRKTRYLLAGIEQQSIERDGEVFADELTPNNVSVEHITPKSPSAEWLDAMNADPEWDEELISRLGNLCLLPGVNQSLGNKSWSEKVVAYGKSRLNTTKRLTQYESWGGAEIIKRQKYMAQLAVTAWRFQ